MVVNEWEEYGLNEYEYETKMKELLSFMRQSQIIAIYRPYINQSTEDKIRAYFRGEITCGSEHDSLIKKLRYIAKKHEIEDEVLGVVYEQYR